MCRPKVKDHLFSTVSWSHLCNYYCSHFIFIDLVHWHIYKIKGFCWALLDKAWWMCNNIKCSKPWWWLTNGKFLTMALLKCYLESSKFSVKSLFLLFKFVLAYNPTDKKSILFINYRYNNIQVVATIPGEQLHFLQPIPFVYFLPLVFYASKSQCLYSHYIFIAMLTTYNLNTLITCTYNSFFWSTVHYCTVP